MATRKIRISIKPLEENLAEFAGVWKELEQAEKVAKHEAIYFESVDVLRSVLTRKRLELLRAIRKNKPGSVYELAKILKRDLKNVTEDVRFLSQLGLIKLKKSRKEKKKNTPVVDYNKISLEISIA